MILFKSGLSLETNKDSLIKSLNGFDSYIKTEKSSNEPTVVITNRKNYLKGMKSLLSKFIQLNIDKSKWLNYIVDLEKKLKEHFQTEYEFKSICPIGISTCPGILYGLSKVCKIVIDNIPKFRPILSTIGTPVYKLAKLANF